ncbi:MAG: NAD(P)-dependent oxidoreductase [Gammaproteobacteria bacterium]|nr:NAD(P)-dependent oxidoreductase [Gammaproteobacteria bacterium]
MKIVVTGANGFIGKHLLKKLNLIKNLHITAVVRPGTSGTEILPADNIVYLDIASPPDNLFSLLGEPDIVIHLSWQGLSDYQSLSHFENELPMQYYFLKLLISGGLKNLVVTGTCFEYGLQSGPLSVDMDTKPVTPYGLAKDSLRKQLEFLQMQKEFNFIWARLFYIYGENQPASTLYQQLKAAVNKDEKVFKMSGGEQLRDYLHVRDVAERLADYALMRKNLGKVNLCSGSPISVRKLVESWIEENNWQIDLQLGHYPYPRHEPMAFWGA